MRPKVKVSSLVPNGISMLNIIFGFLSIISSIEGNFTNAAFFIILAMFADWFDGKVARKVSAVSDIGEQFDSLADMVSFGVASAVLLYLYVLNTMPYGVFIPILVLGCAALRLACFNIEHSINHFTGLPSPAFGFFVAAYVISGITIQTNFVAWIFALAALMMVSTFKYPSLKTTSLRGLAFLIILVIGVAILLWIDTRFIFLPFLVYFFLGPFIYKGLKRLR